MKNNVWYLTAPDGRVVGASARGALCALAEYAWAGPMIDGTAGKSHPSYIALRDMLTEDKCRSDRYEAAGYVLARGEGATHG